MCLTGGSGPCLPTETKGADYVACTAEVVRFVNQGFAKVSTPKDLSSEKTRLPVFVLSFIFDVADEMGLLQQPMQPDEPIFISLMDFLSKAKQVCAEGLTQIKAVHLQLD